MVIKHTSLILTDFSKSWGEAVIGEDEQALEKGATKAKICSTVEEETYVSEDETLNLTRKG